MAASSSARRSTKRSNDQSEIISTTKRVKTSTDVKISVQNASDLIRGMYMKRISENELSTYVSKDLDWTYRTLPCESDDHWPTSLLGVLCLQSQHMKDENDTSPYGSILKQLFANFFDSSTPEQRPAIINTRDSSFTPFHRAAYHAPPHIVKMLFDAGGDLQSQSKKGDTVFMLAVLGGRLETIQLLLDCVPPDQLHLDQIVIECAIEGDIKKKKGALRVKTIMLCKYPIDCNLQTSALDDHIDHLVKTCKLTALDDPNLHEIREALHVGLTIQRYYVRDVISLLDTCFIPVLASIIRTYLNPYCLPL